MPDLLEGENQIAEIDQHVSTVLARQCPAALPPPGLLSNSLVQRHHLGLMMIVAADTMLGRRND